MKEEVVGEVINIALAASLVGVAAFLSLSLRWLVSLANIRSVSPLKTEAQFGPK
jgi:hypothetical protein